MQTTTTQNEFICRIKTKKTVSYTGIELKANLTVIEPRNSKRAYSIDYWYKVGEQWVKFSNLISYFLSDIKQDFQDMINIYEPNKNN